VLIVSPRAGSDDIGDGIASCEFDFYLRASFNEAPESKQKFLWDIRVCFEKVRAALQGMSVVSVKLESADNYDATDVSDAAWALLAPLLPAARPVASRAQPISSRQRI